MFTVKEAMLTGLLTCLVSALVAYKPAGAAEVALSVDPDTVVGKIDEKVYGQFFEHIYHSANGGLWGEMVWNRSFEEQPAGGLWRLEGGEIAQDSLADNVRLTFGDPKWTDYEFSVEAKKTSGAEGFLILFRVASDDDFYWLNLGGWGNQSHAVERGREGEGRWHSITPHVPGAIEADKWCTIRIRCEGRHFQVWLDDREVLNFTDDDKAHLSGAVGLGTWLTRARFRNPKVTSLDGKVLSEALPELTERLAVTRHWEAYGPGRVTVATDNPLNSQLCQKIRSEQGETGLQQQPFCIRRGETYAGSVWVRGEAPKGLIARLRDGEETLAEVKLRPPTRQWQSVPIAFHLIRDAENATLQLGVVGNGEVWLDQVSLMPQACHETGGFRPDLLQAIADLQPPVIRWPGGCFAEFYRWKDAIGPQHTRKMYPLSIWDDLDVNSLGTDEFVDLCRRVGAEPLIVIDLGSHAKPEERAAYIQEACDWVEYCNGPASSKWGRVRAENGHREPYGVKYWEIDNETWRMGAEAYVAAVREFVPALKKVDPALKIAVCGSGGMNLEWNKQIIDGCGDLAHYLSLHHYENPDRFADGPRAYERFFEQTGEAIVNSKNPFLHLYVSEWNAQSTDWRTGLYAGGLLNAFERCGDVLEIGGPALFLRHVSATDWDNAFLNFDHRTWFPAPNYVVMKLYREHYAPDRLALSGDPGALNAVATRSADSKQVCVKAVNPSDQPIDVRLEVKDTFVAHSASLKLVAPDSLSARNTLESRDTVHVVDGKLGRNRNAVTFTLPRWSVGVVTLQR